MSRKTKRLTVLVMSMFLVASIMGCAEHYEEMVLPDFPEESGETLYPVFDSIVGKTGLKNSDNQWVIMPKYNNDGVILLVDNYFLCRSTDENEKYQYEYLSKKGNNLIGRSFQEAYNFSKGTALVAENSMYKVMDYYGKTIYEGEPKYDVEKYSAQLIDNILVIEKRIGAAGVAEGDVEIYNTLQKRWIYRKPGKFHQILKNGLIIIIGPDRESIMIDRSGNELHRVKDLYVVREGVTSHIILTIFRADSCLSRSVDNSN